MGMISNIKKNIKQEIMAYKYNRQLENDPAVVHSRLTAERKEIKLQTERLTLQRQMDQDKQELRDLKNSTGFRGKLRSGLGSIRSHLDNVKARNQGSNKMKLKDPSKSMINQGVGSKESNYKPFGSGMVGQGSVEKPKKDKKKRIIIEI